jgi:hypothetical protein
VLSSPLLVFFTNKEFNATATTAGAGFIIEKDWDFDVHYNG